MKSSIIQTKCGPIEYTWEGDKTKPVIAFMHGTPGGYGQGFLIDQQFGNQYSRLSWSRPGYCQTPISTGRTFYEQADALIAFMDEFNIKKVILVAVSGGGGPALAYAIKYPERLKALVLESALSERYAIPKAQKLLAQFMLNRVTHWIYCTLFKYFPHYIIKQLLSAESNFDQKMLNQETLRVIQNKELLHSFSVLIGTLKPSKMYNAGLANDLAQYSNFNLPLNQITAPTFIMHGAQDKDALPDNAEHSHKCIKNSTIHWIQNAGHLFWIARDYSQVVAELNTFVQTIQ